MRQRIPRLGTCRGWGRPRGRTGRQGAKVLVGRPRGPGPWTAACRPGKPGQRSQRPRQPPRASASSLRRASRLKAGDIPRGRAQFRPRASLLGRVARIGLSTSCTRMLRPWAPQTPTVPGWVARASAGMRDGGNARGRAWPLRPRVGAPRALAAGAAAAVPEGAVCHVLTEIVGAGPARSGSAAV